MSELNMLLTMNILTTFLTLLVFVKTICTLRITTKGPLCGRRDAAPCSCQCKAKQTVTFKDCSDVVGESGLYLIRPLGTETTFEVFCDMTTDGGGWTVFQRRKDGSENFYRGWVDYENGFGSLEGEFWLGNLKIHNLTRGRHYELRIDMRDFEGNAAYAKYSGFSLGDTSTEYMLTVSGYTGNAGDGLERHNGIQFFTFDKDVYDCALKYKGGWWYDGAACYSSNLNGFYHKEARVEDWDGIMWDWYRNPLRYSLQTTELKIRRP